MFYQITALIVLITLEFLVALTRTPNQGNLFPVIAPKRFSYVEILQSTSAFTECSLLGAQSFSSVYKGTFSDGVMDAIKVFDLQLEG